MNSIRLFNRQVGLIVMAAALLFATFIPALVSAALVTERSIELSSSSATATGVTYKINFTSVAAAKAFVVEFCSDSPIIGQDCTAPTGFSATAAASATSGFTNTEDIDANTIRSVGTIGATTPISVDVTGITNPTNAGVLYARIVTFDGLDAAAAEAAAEAYTSTAPGADKVDEGGVAISITPTVAVSGAVLESMTFCVSGATITADCASASATPPTLQLGETVGSTKALSTTAVSTGTIHTQISTNAVGGAVVRLKSSTDCGGMKRVGATVCDIAPALTSGDIAPGDAKIGVKTATATDTGSNPNGTFQPFGGSTYNSSNFRLNYVAGNASGITSTFGDPFLDTDDAPVNNKNMALTFGASISNNTPAGAYSTSLSLIAVGKF